MFMVKDYFFFLVLKTTSEETGISEQDIISKKRNADMDMDGAADIYGRLEGEMMYNNYLSEDEADNIASGFVNQDGSHGAHWSKSDVKAYIERVGGLMESSPYYNKCAMYVTFNMVYSDFHNALNKAVLGDSGKYMSAVYEMAVSFLKDVDNKRWIRHHYRID